MHIPSTILIVDDDPIGQETIESLLFKEGYIIASANNGFEAIEQAASLMPDVILLDVMMPGMDGFEVCRRIRSDERVRDIPIVLVTALDDTDSRLAGFNAGADDFISKPFNRAELRARVRTITRLNRYRRLLHERARFEWVVEQAHDGFVLIDAADTISFANRQACVYLNIPEQTYRSLSDTPPAQRHYFREQVAHYYHCKPLDAWSHWPLPCDTMASMNNNHNTKFANCPMRYLVQPETSTTPAMWLQVETIELPVQSNDNYLVRLRDVTQHITNQRHKWTFHSMISHKLNTPLTGLINSLHLLASDAHLLTPDEVHEFANIALQSAHRLNNQLRSIRNYVATTTLIEDGIKCEVSCLHSLIMHVCNELELDMEYITVICTTPPTHDSHMNLSHKALELILHQILDNAHKFHPQHKPTITIQSTYDIPGYITVTITDDGTRLTAEQIAHVWVPYYQAEKGFSGEVHGMGLGLAMVASMLWSVGGTYTMTNRNDSDGVIITLRIPFTMVANTIIADDNNATTK